MIKSLAKTTAVIVSSTILATLSVNAVDMSGYFSRTMLGALLFSSAKSTAPQLCPHNMVLVQQALTLFCVDMYEASPSEACVYANPQNENESALNLTNQNCTPVSEPSSMPWRFMSYAQAEQACERVGKRLPTAGEWYKAALGTPDQEGGWNEESCNVVHNRADGVSKTGSGMRCVSDVGAYDMIGNVWEWAAETVERGSWEGRELPQTGFVEEVDFYGIANTTGTQPAEGLHDDRFWLDASISAGMMRGGYYNSQSHAGLHAVYAASPKTFTGNAVGFRCVSTPLSL